MYSWFKFACQYFKIDEYKKLLEKVHSGDISSTEINKARKEWKSYVLNHFYKNLKNDNGVI